MLSWQSIISAQDANLRMALFQSFWFGDSLPKFAVMAMQSFLDHGHDYHLYSYSGLELPAGARLLDAGQILPSNRVFHYRQPDGSRGSVSAFSNLFRYEMLRRNGGWWIDTDVVCLSRDVPQTDTFWGWQDLKWICSAILKVPPGHPLAEQAFHEADSAGTDITWGQCGPYMVTRLVRQLGLEDRSCPPEIAYPVYHTEHLLPVTTEGHDEAVRRLDGKPFLHLWHEKFRRSNDPRIDNPEPGSFLDTVYRRHAAR